MTVKQRYQHLRAHFKRRSGRRKFGYALLSVFSALILVSEAIDIFFPDLIDVGWGGLLAVIGVALLAAGWHSRPRSEVIRTLPPSDRVVRIKVGDLLEQSGNIVVGSNDTFDTDLGDGIINPASVQGQLLERVFEGDRAALDTQIHASLEGVKTKSLPSKPFGKTRAYPIGTVAIVEKGDQRIFLPAIATMSRKPPPRVNSSLEDLQLSLARTWQAVDDAGQREDVHAPILGSKHARLGLTKTLLIQFIVLSFFAVDAAGNASLTIWISDADAVEVDLAELDQWLRGVCT